MLRIGFAYNLKEDTTLHEEHLADSAAEYEDVETIDAIHNALTNISSNIVHLPCNRDFLRSVQEKKPDVVFNIAEGYGGRNREGYAPTILEMMGIPHTGSDALSLSLTLDKAHTKRILRAENIPTPDFCLIDDPADLTGIDLEFPMFVKPAREGTSKGIRNHSKVNDLGELRAQVKWVLDNYDQPALVEEFVCGREFATAVLHNNNMNLLPIVEVIFHEDKSPFYSYECKLNVEESLKCPADISDELKRKIDDYTLKIFRLFDLKDLARIDIRVDADDVPQVLEVNALPGLSPQYSLYPIQAREAGISYDDMICEIMANAIKANGM
jgi:D-alanine-D-alanine ligase